MKEVVENDQHVPVRPCDSAGKRVDTTVNVTHVRAIPQPLGTLFDRMLNDQSEVGDKRFVQEKIGIIGQHPAAYALYVVTVSGDKVGGKPAFDGCIQRRTGPARR